MSGANEGTTASDVSAAPSASSGSEDRKAPRLAASHRPRSAAGGDREPASSKQPAQVGGFGITVRTPLQGVSAHDTDDRTVLRPGRPAPGRRSGRAAPGRARRRGRGRPATTRRCGRRASPGSEKCRRGPGVSRACRDVSTGTPSSRGTTTAPRRRTDSSSCEAKRAPQEQRLGDADGAQVCAALTQVEPGHPPAGEGPGPGPEAPVPVGQRGDVDDASVGLVHPATLERVRHQLPEEHLLVCMFQPTGPEPGADVGAVAQQEVHALRVADEVDAPGARR